LVLLVLVVWVLQPTVVLEVLVATVAIQLLTHLHLLVVEAVDKELMP
tara:strand:- start:392 stop:532 length:141 start_codon:yes stop_codon:yes gene_type:complete